jgi:60 kDa SS-A/Ro ribonucleoprotein
MSDPLAVISTRTTSQSDRADLRQRQNAAGGYTFVPAEVDRLRRFLTLGSAGGTYYVGERELTSENAGLVLE